MKKLIFIGLIMTFFISIQKGKTQSRLFLDSLVYVRIDDNGKDFLVIYTDSTFRYYGRYGYSSSFSPAEGTIEFVNDTCLILHNDYYLGKISKSCTFTDTTIKGSRVEIYDRAFNLYPCRKVVFNNIDTIEFKGEIFDWGYFTYPSEIFKIELLDEISPIVYMNDGKDNNIRLIVSYHNPKESFQNLVVKLIDRDVLSCDFKEGKRMLYRINPALVRLIFFRRQPSLPNCR